MGAFESSLKDLLLPSIVKFSFWSSVGSQMFCSSFLKELWWNKQNMKGLEPLWTAGGKWKNYVENSMF